MRCTLSRETNVELVIVTGEGSAADIVAKYLPSKNSQATSGFRQQFLLKQNNMTNSQPQFFFYGRILFSLFLSLSEKIMH